MELWDLYTSDRKLTDKKMYRGEDTPKGYFRLVVGVCIFNSKGEMLIQKRQSFKPGWSGMWDISVGGAAISGDDSRTAAEREVMEELGLKISLEGVPPKFSFGFESVFGDFYFINMDVDLDSLTLQEEEVEDVAWATKEQIHQMIDDEEFISYDKSIIDMMFFLSDHGDTRTRADFTSPKEMKH
ncbi:MAG: NUDIX domain-containing protein [Clostridia bacterium]|nr:NUDIX domain-containing protein [Clostridia bacterium]